ncbi:peroxisomal sarcosine oxidase-like [Neocloeon triangulifer]|uniref:peroxisomal sarcosine oxidase-like n=1 Tax=Neocloeon triangulifer TaxID=2078957 RepID=UPI00286F04DF|nr:peroxisomal sarcosine oxidase-like [Neocloeon triangulifer]XP_059483204.1 peroxisomal sarcosine oxidase-like [Neocloeon triangulifer]
MAEHYDYIVIGAGIEGSWTAYQLIKGWEKAPSVLLLERFPLPHSRGSSHGQTRIIRNAYPESYHTAIMPTAFAEWQKLENESGAILLVSKPLLLIADEKGYQKMDTIIDCVNKEKEKQPGVKIDLKELSNDELKRQFPQANIMDWHRGCVEYTAGILRADKCLATVQSKFKKLGGVIRDGFEVTSVVPGETVTVKGQLNYQEAQVSTSKLAICAGPWASKLIDPLLLKKLPLQTLRILVFYWKIKENGPGAIPTSFIDCGEADFWGIPELEYPGLYKLCNPSYSDFVDPDDRDKNIGHPDYASMSNYIEDNFPGLESKPSIVETCMYTVTPDLTCILDTIPGHGNIAFGCGFSGIGFKKAPAVGIMLKQLLNPGDKKILDPSAFALGRF